MNCRSCNAEIADKAIVCYRCGTSTTEPTFAPPSARRLRAPVSLVATTVALVLLGLLVLYMQRAGSLSSSPTLRWVLVGVAVVIVVLRGIARRTRR
jgi:hypothetical protein